MQVPTLGFVKLNFTYLYRRIFWTGSVEIFGYFTVAMICMMVLLMISLFLALLFICGLKFALWWSLIKVVNAYCGDFRPYYRRLCAGIAFAWGKLENCLEPAAVTQFIFDLDDADVVRSKSSRGQDLFPQRGVSLLLLKQCPLRHGVISQICRIVDASATRMIVYMWSIVSLKKSYRSQGYDSGKPDRSPVFLRNSPFDYERHCWPACAKVTATTGIYWSSIESGIALIACCLPAIYELIRRKTRPLRKLSRTSKPQSGPSEGRAWLVPGVLYPIAESVPPRRSCNSIWSLSDSVSSARASDDSMLRCSSRWEMPCVD